MDKVPLSSMPQRHWDRVIRALPDGFRMITYDRRGHGASSQSDDYSFQALVCDLEALIKERELSERNARWPLSRCWPRARRRRAHSDVQGNSRS